MPDPRSASAVAIAEDAVHLLRRTPLATFVLHLIGSAPFALSVLVLWSDVTQYRPSEAEFAADAAIAAAGLAWMNSWRALYAGRLYDALRGTTGARPKLWRVIGLQSFLGATKLIVLPLAALVLFPYASVVAFYRYAAALATGSADRGPRETIAHAAALARRESRLHWGMLPFLALLQLITALNVAAVIAAMPILVRILTGYESVFSRNLGAFVQNPLFAMSAIMVTWMALDPFVQAVYCVMCFRLESRETGEDLRVALRRLRSAASVGIAAALALAACAVRAAFPERAWAAIPPEQLRQSIQQAARSHQYDWRLPPDTAAPSRPSWLLDAVDAIFHFIGAIFKAIGHAIDALLRWIFGRLSLPTPQGGAPPAVALHWSIYLLSAIVAGLALWLVWRMRKAKRLRPKPVATPAAAAVRLADENVTPDRLPEEQWIEMAEGCLRDGDYRLALRAFYLANLAWLGRREVITISAGKTNGEYEREAQRKLRGYSEAALRAPAEPRDLLRANVAAFERAWYGSYSPGPEDAAEFRARNDRMKELLDAPAGVAA